MKKWVLAASAAMCLAGAANAGVITLSGVTENGPNDFTFTYSGSLGPDEGLRSGDKLIIMDFGGYIEGSIFSPFENVTASIEFVSPTAAITPGFDDNADIENLVFTYNGPDFRAEGGPFESFNFEGLTARSMFSGLTVDAFYGLSTKNNPDGVPGGTGTPIFSLGSVTVPVVPEPATWAMMIGGFGLAGTAMRRRTRVVRVTA